MIDSHGLLTISGEGDYTISGYSSTPWSAYGGYIESAKVEASNITSLKFMFNDLEELKQVDLSGLDTSKVTNMRGMFSGCLALEEVDFTVYSMYILLVSSGSLFDMATFCNPLPFTVYQCSTLVVFGVIPLFTTGTCFNGDCTPKLLPSLS